MSQGKDKSNICVRIYRMKYSARYIIIGICTLIFSYFLVNYVGRSALSAVSFLSSDRSETYNVKVLPDNVDDASLNGLPKESFSYLAMIDAGSSGCRAHVYKYGKLGSVRGPLYVLPQHVSKKVKPGLSSFAQKPDAAGASLADLVVFIKEQVPEVDWAVTPIWLKATAGLRMLEKAQSDAILGSVRRFLSTKENSPFLFRNSWAGIISGNEEGGFGWIAYNYLKKIIGPKKAQDAEDHYAVIEMGGASAQVTQAAPTLKDAESIPQEYRFSFTIEQDSFHLYTHSYLGFGAEQAREQVNNALVAENHRRRMEAAESGSSSNGATNSISDPCLNRGYHRSGLVPRKEVYEGPAGLYFNISGAASKEDTCMNFIRNLFTENEVNNNKHCSTSQQAPYSFACTHQPAFLANTKNLLLFENFYYSSSAIGVRPNPDADAAAPVSFPLVTSVDRIHEATDSICDTEWSTLQTSYPKDKQPKDVNTKMCFVGSYAYSFLTDGLKLPRNKLVTIQKDVGPSEIEWALGAAYKEAADFLKRTHLRPV